MSIDDATPSEWNDITVVDTNQQPDPLADTAQVKRSDAEIQKPLHYNQEYIGYLRGNSLKYRWRFPYKHGIKDIYKAEFYEQKLVEKLEKDGS